VKLAVALDPLYLVLAKDLASRYCPVDRTLFLGRLGSLFAAFVLIALLLFVAARLARHNPQRKALIYLAASAVILFAIGSGSLVIFGLSGCSGATQAGLTWDWP
jgi:hypothetical protein